VLVNGKVVLGCARIPELVLLISLVLVSSLLLNKLVVSFDTSLVNDAKRYN